MRLPQSAGRGWRIGIFDGFVLAGALVNVAVVGILFIYWMLN